MLCLVGATSEPLSVQAFTLLGAQKTVTGSAIGGRPAIREMLAFAARHGVAAKTQSRPLAEADAALGDVRKGRARYRIVFGDARPARSAGRSAQDGLAAKARSQGPVRGPGPLARGPNSG